MANTLTEYNGYVHGTGNETVGYVTNGDSDDWAYGEQTTKNKILSMTPEVGNIGFYPPASAISGECREMLVTNVDLAGLLLANARFTSLVPTTLSANSGFLPYSIRRIGLDTGSYSVSAISLSPLLQIAATAQVHPGLSLLQSASDSLSYTILPGAVSGSTFQLVFATNQNGLYTTYDTVNVLYGNLSTVATPGTASLAAWTTTSWGVDNQYFYSPPSCLSESPGVPYPNNNTATMTLTNAVDLTNATAAFLRFHARWDIEKGYDYTVVEAKDSLATTWTPLCGKFTHPGSNDQILGAPLYDGTETTWVAEEMNLQDYLGKKMNLRYRRKSDGFVNGEGFFLDDMTVDIVANGNAIATNLVGQNGIKVYPNPATDELVILLPATANFPVRLSLSNSMGQMVQQATATSRETRVDLKALATGIYYLQAVDNSGVFAVQKVVVGK